MLALLRNSKVTQGIREIGPYHLPEKVRVIGPQIGGTAEVQFLAYSSLVKLVEQSSCLTQVVDISKLSDQICCTQEPRKIISWRVLLLLGDREPRVLDVSFDLRGIEMTEHRLVKRSRTNSRERAT